MYMVVAVSRGGGGDRGGGGGGRGGAAGGVGGGGWRSVAVGRGRWLLKAPVCRSPEFLAEWCQNKKSDFERVFQALEDLDQKHVAFHLLQTCMGWSQLNYLGRTAPRHFLVPLLD